MRPGEAAAGPSGSRDREQAALSVLLRRAMSEIDANLRLSFEEVSYQGVLASGWDLDATLFRDTVTVRSFTLNDLAGITLSGAGQIGPGEGGIEWEWAWDGQTESLSDSLQALETLLPLQTDMIDAPPRRSGAFISVQIFGDEAAVQGQANLRLGDIGATVIGRIDSPWDRQERFYDGTFDIDHGPNGMLRHYITLPGAFSATGAFTGTASQWQITELEVLLNETEAQGELRWQSGVKTGERNLLSGSLAFGVLPNLPDMASLHPNASAVSVPPEQSGSGRLQSAFSALLPPLDVALSVQIDKLGSRGTALENLSLSVFDDARGLRFEDIKADLAGGRLAGRVTQDAQAFWRGEVQIEEARLETLFDRNPAFRPSGRLDLELTAASRGDLKRDWIADLNGDGLLTLTGINVGNGKGSTIASYMARMFEGGVIARRLTVPIDLHNGVLTADEVALSSDRAQGDVSLQLDLPRWQLEGQINLDTERSTAPFRISFSGDLSEPLTRVTMPELPVDLGAAILR